MYNKDLVLNNQQWFICHKTKPNQSKSYIFNIYVEKLITMIQEEGMIY